MLLIFVFFNWRYVCWKLAALVLVACCVRAHNICTIELAIIQVRILTRTHNRQKRKTIVIPVRAGLHSCLRKNAFLHVQDFPARAGLVFCQSCTYRTATILSRYFMGGTAYKVVKNVPPKNFWTVYQILTFDPSLKSLGCVQWDQLFRKFSKCHHQKLYQVKLSVFSSPILKSINLKK